MSNRMAPRNDWNDSVSKNTGPINPRASTNSPKATAVAPTHPNMSRSQKAMAGVGGLSHPTSTAQLPAPGTSVMDPIPQGKAFVGQVCPPVVGHRSRGPSSDFRDRMVSQALSEKVFDHATASGGADFHDRLFHPNTKALPEDIAIVKSKPVRQP